jgi:hemerythrin-like domain-containing protein
VADYGHELHFGVFLPPAAADADLVVAAAQEADELGLDWVSLQDHPYQPAFLDTWTLLTHIAARTDRVTVFPNVANLPLRPPAMLARSVASLDIVSNGRVELGLGAGAFWDGIEAMGGPRREPGAAVDALEEAIGVIRALWTPGRTPQLNGRHYRLRGAKPGPFPVHPVGIWLGAYKRRMLDLTGRVADGWVPSLGYADPSDLPKMNAVIDEAAEEAGRTPADIKRIFNIQGSFVGSGFLQGPPRDWVDQLVDLALEAGISGFVLMADVEDRRDMHRFAEEVAPAVRGLVEAERSRGRRDDPGNEVQVQERDAALEAALSAPYDEGPGVVPTPAPTQRLSDTTLWDESSRPHAPAAAPGTRYTSSGRTDAQHLVAVHDHLRQELTQIRDLVDQVAQGYLDAGDARSLMNKLTMRQNNWTLGAYCESYCRVVTTHHTLEDVTVFPRLRAADPRLRPVMERLEEEHRVIAEVLEGVDRSLVALVASPVQGIEGVRRAVDLLTDVLLSHLSYEEVELVEPLARLNIGGI